MNEFYCNKCMHHHHIKNKRVGSSNRNLCTGCFDIENKSKEMAKKKAISEIRAIEGNKNAIEARKILIKKRGDKLRHERELLQINTESWEL